MKLEDFFSSKDEPEPGKVSFMGMQLPYDGTLGVPVEAVIILKTMDEGDFGYRLLSTPDLNTVEALGMTCWAQELIKLGFDVRQYEDDNDEEG